MGRQEDGGKSTAYLKLVHKSTRNKFIKKKKKKIFNGNVDTMIFHILTIVDTRLP